MRVDIDFMIISTVRAEVGEKEGVHFEKTGLKKLKIISGSLENCYIYCTVKKVVNILLTA